MLTFIRDSAKLSTMPLAILCKSINYAVGYHVETHAAKPNRTKTETTTRIMISKSILPRTKRYRASAAAWRGFIYPKALRDTVDGSSAKARWMCASLRQRFSHLVICEDSTHCCAS